MKKYIFLILGFFIWCDALSQGTPKFELLSTRNTGSTFSKSINARTYTITTIDTTLAMQTVDWKTNVLCLQTLDTATILISYQLSTNGTNWFAKVLQDSLQNKTTTGTVKTTDFSSIVLGSPFIRFIFAFDVKSFSWTNGVGTKTYTAGLMRRTN